MPPITRTTRSATGNTPVSSKTTPVHPAGPRFKIDLKSVTSAQMDGYGAQYNQTVFLPGKDKISGIDAANVGRLQKKLDRLQPQLVRVFLNTAVFTDPKEKAAFLKTLAMAQKSGAAVNVTWWHGPYPKPAEMMQSFATLMKECVVDRKLTCVKSLTIQNEVNSTKVTPPEYERLYRLLDGDLKQAGIRKDLKLIGGDLLQTDQKKWIDHLGQHMGDVLDGYSVHIYWDYRDPSKMERRLRDVRALVNAQPPKGRKPIYVTEYGVRGIYTGGKDQPGHLRDGTPVGDSNVNAFQHGWFNALSSQLGIKGAISWDAYSGGPGNQFGKFGMIADGHSDFRLKPSYFLTELFTHAMKPGWSAVHVAQAGKGELVTAFTGPRGESSVLALNQGATDKPFTFEGLKPGTTYHVASWNRRGGGGLAGEKDVVVSRAGTVSVAVPKGGVLALSTEPLKL